MKRVLNSGTIKLPYVKGSEAAILPHIYDNMSKVEYAMDLNIYNDIKFTFEIKAPLLVFLAFQDSNLGTLKRLHELDHPIAYLPPQFYNSNNFPLDTKTCNTYNTKLYNFYNAVMNFHDKLIVDGLSHEQADLVLPQGMLINFSWEVTAPGLIEFIEKYYANSPELYGYCTTFLLYLEEHLPFATKWLKQNRWQYSKLC